MSDKKILSIGEILWDLFPDGEKLGGAPANFACHAAIQDNNVCMLSAVGRDAQGDEARRILDAYAIDCSLIQSIQSAPTGMVSVQVDAAGRPEFAIHDNSAWDQIAWSQELESCIDQFDAIYFGTLAQRSIVTRETIRKTAERAKQKGVLRVFDVNLRSPFFNDTIIRESIEWSSILKLSDEELERVAVACNIPAQSNDESKLKHLLNQFELDLVAMTCGPDGAILVSKHEMIDEPGIPTTVVDTVGAGDSFTAALVTGWLRGDSLASIARYACETASATCSHRGAVPQPNFLYPQPNR
jgi:fructokinase